MKQFLLIFTILIASGSMTFASFRAVTTPQSAYINVMHEFDNEIFAGYNGSGIYKNTNHGESWTNVSPNNEVMNITDLCDDGENIYASSYSSGLFISSDKGGSWTQIGNQIKAYHITAISTSNDTIVAGTDGFGIFISPNGGTSWFNISKGLFHRDISNIIITQSNSIVASSFSGMVYYSKDLSGNWKKSASQDIINDMTVASSGRIYAATEGRSLIYSDNGAVSWEVLSDKLYDESNQTYSDMQHLNTTSIAIYNNTIVIGTASKGIYYYMEAPVSAWVKASLNSPVDVLASDQDGYFYTALSDGTIYLNSQSGQYWVKKTKPVTDTKYHLITDNNKGLLFVFKDSGYLFKSSDKGLTWVELENIPIEKINEISIDKHSNIHLATDKGLYSSSDQGNSWFNVLTDPRSEDDWEFLSVEEISLGTVFASFLYDAGPENDDVFESKLFLSDNGGASWTNVLEENKKIDNLIAMSGGVLLANTNGLFSKSDNYGKTFTQYGFAGKSIDHIKSDEKLIVLSQNGIYRSTNGGLDFNPLQNILDDGSQNAKVTQLDNSYSGKTYSVVSKSDTELGEYDQIYYSTNDGNNWKPYHDNGFIKTINSITSDLNGYTYYSADQLYKQRDSVKMTAPIIEHPANLMSAVDVSPVFSLQTDYWNYLSELEIADDAEFENILETAVFAGDEYTTASVFENNTVHYARVRAINGSEKSQWTEILFQTMLEAPALKSPINNSTGIAKNNELIWYSAEGVESYHIQIAADEFFEEVVYENSDITVLKDRVPELASSTVHYWRVRSESSDNISNWSQVWSFVTASGPPILLFPTDGETNVHVSVNLMWEEEGSATSYHVQIATNSSFTEGLTEYPEHDDIILSVQLEDETEYFWRVATNIESNKSNWSETRSFTTGIAPVTLLTPLNGSVNISTNTLLTWEEHELAGEYILEIAENNSFDEAIQIITDQTEYIFEEADFLTEYFWRVKVKKDDGTEGHWSNVFSFSTNIASPELLKPQNNAEIQALNAKLIWAPVNDAEYYHLEIAKDETFDNIIFDESNLTDTEFKPEALEYGTTYFWRVKAYAFEGEIYSEWSETFSFTTHSFSIDLVQPENNATGLQKNIQFTWQKVDNAESYVLQFSKDPDMEPILFEEGPMIVLGTFVDDFEPSTRYYWRLRVNMPDLGAVNSEIRTFVTDNFTSVESIGPSELIVFPNPANDWVNFVSQNNGIIQSIELTDNYGRSVANINEVNSSEYSLNCKGLSAGTYFVKLVQSEKIIYKKIHLFK